MHGFFTRSMSKYLSYILPLYFCTVLYSCKYGTDNANEDTDADSVDVDSMGLEKLDLFKEAVIPESADELFDDFLYSYISSEKFKAERTQTDTEELELTEDEPLIVIYERETDLELQKDTSLVHVLLEKIEWGEELIKLFDFNRIKGKWYLTEEGTNEISNTPNASFLVFLKDFINDSVYQRESLKLPVVFEYSSEDEEETLKKLLSYEEWREFVSDLPDMTREVVNIDYGQSLISTNRKSVMLKGFSNGLLITFHFDFRNGRWHLFEIKS